MDSGIREQLGCRAARWVKCDFHLHTPGSHTFKRPAGVSAEELISAYVDKLAGAGIEVAAITDYQQIHPEWYKPIRKKAASRGIRVFPGVELSISAGKYGLHVIAIFPYDGDLEAFNRTIQRIDEKTMCPLINDHGEHRSIVSNDTPSALKNLRRETQCLLIMAHASEDKGLMNSFSPKRAAQFLCNVQPNALEAIQETDLNRILSTSDISGTLLARIARLECSDPKNLVEIGTKTKSDGAKRCSYMKLSKPYHLDGLRLALRDESVLVKVGEEPELRYVQVLGLETKGEGFLGKLNLGTGPELNAFIGSRGSGKSAVLETIRYVLDLRPHDQSDYREHLPEYALGKEGEGAVYLQIPSSPTMCRCYRVTRVLDEEPCVYECNENKEERVPLSPRDLFPDGQDPLFFGQRELYEIAIDEKNRLSLIDQLTGNALEQHLREIDRLTAALGSNSQEIAKYLTKLIGREELEGDLQRTKHKIGVYDQAGLPDTLLAIDSLNNVEADLNRIHQQPAQGAPSSSGEAGLLSSSRQSWAEWFEELDKEIEQRCNALTSRASSEDKLPKKANEVIEKVRQSLTQLLAEMNKVRKRGGKVFDKAEAEMESALQHWQDVREPFDEQKRESPPELEGDLDYEDYLDLKQKERCLEKKLKSLDSTESALRDARQKREALLDDLDKARRAACAARQNMAESITNALEERVIVDVQFHGQLDTFGDQLVALAKGSHVHEKDLRDAVASGVVNGREIASYVRGGSQTVSRELGLSEAWAESFCKHFNDPSERDLHKLETIAADDLVQISLKMEAGYKSLSQLSDGGRATAMLLILLAQESRLLFLDQPEDDLDNTFICEDIVSQLRKQKQRRQIVVATHNPNLPVLGHAENITVMEAESGEASIGCQGGIDSLEIQDKVKRIMEGGQDALRRRAEKYGMRIVSG